MGAINRSLRSRTQITANEQGQIVRPIGAAKWATPPPTLPDMLGSQAKIELRTGRWVVTITKPETRTNSTPCWLVGAIARLDRHAWRRFVTLIPPRTPMLPPIQLLPSLTTSPTLLQFANS